MPSPMYQAGRNRERDDLKNQVRRMEGILREGSIGGVGPNGAQADAAVDAAAMDLVRVLTAFGYTNAGLPENTTTTSSGDEVMVGDVPAMVEVVDDTVSIALPEDTTTVQDGTEVPVEGENTGGSTAILNVSLGGKLSIRL